MCNKHPTSKTYLNPDTGDRCCWDCYLENGFYDYNGKVILTYDRVQPYYLRMILVDRHVVIIEGWKNTSNGYVRVGRPRNEQFMSTASRTWKSLVKDLDKTGKLRINGRE